MLRVLHFADAHIDMANQGRHDPVSGLPVRILDFLKALDTIVDTAINERVDLVLWKAHVLALAGKAKFSAAADAYGVAAADSANCVIVKGKRGGDVRFAACVVLATTRADVNGVVRRRLDVRSASFAPMDEAVALTGMEYGGITPLGLPAEWPILVDAAVAASAGVVVGAGIRGAKLFLPGAVLAALPGAEIVEGLGRPIG